MKLKDSIAHHAKSLWSKLSWEEGVCALLILLLIAINQLLLSSLVQLPSPLYGGDYYNHLGSIEHLYQGGSIFESGQMLGEIQWVPWLYHLMVTWFSWISGLSPMLGIIYFSQVALVLGCVITYVFVSKFFNNKLFGLLAVLWQGWHYPIFKYSPFSFFIVMPLFLLAAYSFIKKPTYRNAILFGVAYGLAGLSNTFMFIQNTFLLGFLLLYYVFYHDVKLKPFSYDQKKIIENLGKAATIFLIGFAIALLWWFYPIFVYHAHTPNDMQIYGFPEVRGLGDMIGMVIQGVKNEFFNFWLVGHTTLLIGALAGIALLFLLKHKREEHRFVIILLIAAFFGLCTHFITLPLFHTLIAPIGLFDVGVLTTILLLFLIALEVGMKYANKLHAVGGVALLLLVAVLFSIGLNQYYARFADDQWFAIGRSPMNPYLTETRNWALENTELNDVFLSTNEDSFALNALTGRKIVTYRRTHSSPYTDMNQRMLDAGLMLYSNKDDVREALLKKYSVDYVYWQPNWIGNEFRFDESGQLQGFFDPLMLDYTPKREDVLKENNVTYIRTQWYLDPAWLPTYPKRDVLVITPSRLNAQSPWSEKFDKYLTVAKELNISGQPMFRIYKVNI